MELPPCIKKAVSARDKEALDEVFSFLRSFADDEVREKILWSIGYYDLGNYQQRKLTAEAQINSAPPFICNPLKKPEHLSKYCTPKDEAACPLRDPITKLKMLIKSVYVEHRAGEPYATLVVELRDGAVFRRLNGAYGLHDPSGFWLASAERFLNWLWKTRNDFVLADPGEVARFLSEKAEWLEVGSNAVAAVR